LRAEGFFCSLDVLYGGLGIGKLLFINFWSSKPWIRIGIQPKMLDPDPELVVHSKGLKLLDLDFWSDVIFYCSRKGQDLSSANWLNPESALNEHQAILIVTIVF
jgi:hypothetical protein